VSGVIQDPAEISPPLPVAGVEAVPVVAVPVPASKVLPSVAPARWSLAIAWLQNWVGHNWKTTVSGIVFAAATIVQHKEQLLAVAPNRYHNAATLVIAASGLIIGLAAKDAGRRQYPLPGA
jgi:hypothetical protein